MATKLFSDAVRVSAIARLKANSTLNALIAGRVYDYVSDNPVYPFVRYGEDNFVVARPMSQWETSEEEITIHCFSRERDRAQVLQMNAAVVEIIENDAFGIAGTGGILNVVFLRSQVIEGPDREWHGINQFAVTLGETT